MQNQKWVFRLSSSLELDQIDSFHFNTLEKCENLFAKNFPI